MRFSASVPERVLLALFGLWLAAGAAGCSFFQDEEPDPALLEQRTAALIAVGWQWLHAENVAFMGGGRQGERYVATFQYDVVLDVAEGQLPAFEKERFAAFLPMCRGIPMQPGSRCRLTERIPFVKTENHGWMPELAVRLMPDQLAAIAEAAKP